MELINSPNGATDCICQATLDTALTDFNPGQFKTPMKKMDAQVEFCLSLQYSLQCGAWKLAHVCSIKVILTYHKLSKFRSALRLTGKANPVRDARRLKASVFSSENNLRFAHCQEQEHHTQLWIRMAPKFANLVQQTVMMKAIGVVRISDNGAF